MMCSLTQSTQIGESSITFGLTSCLLSKHKSHKNCVGVVILLSAEHVIWVLLIPLLSSVGIDDMLCQVVFEQGRRTRVGMGAYIVEIRPEKKHYRTSQCIVKSVRQVVTLFSIMNVTPYYED